MDASLSSPLTTPHCFQSPGTSALGAMLTTILADYVHQSHLGRASALLGIAAGSGALFAVFVLMGVLPTALCIKLTYNVVAAYAFGAMLLCGFGLQSHAQLKSGQDYLEPESRNVFKLLYIGLRVAYDDLRVALAYLAGFLARGGTVTVTVFISLWVNSHHLTGGECSSSTYSSTGRPSNGSSAVGTACGEALVGEAGPLCLEAIQLAATLSGTAQAVALLCAPFWGWLGDVLSPVAGMGLAALVGCVAYGMVFVPLPIESAAMYAIAGSWGLAEIGMVIMAQVLVTRHMPSASKGTCAGCFGLFGSFGVLTQVVLGGLLFDSWFPGAPFVLSSAISVVVLLGAMVVFIARPKSTASRPASLQWKSSRNLTIFERTTDKV